MPPEPKGNLAGAAGHIRIPREILQAFQEDPRLMVDPIHIRGVMLLPDSILQKAGLLQSLKGKGLSVVMVPTADLGPSRIKPASVCGLAARRSTGRQQRLAKRQGT